MADVASGASGSGQLRVEPGARWPKERAQRAILAIVYGFPMLPGLRGTGLNPSTSLSQAGAVQTWLRPGNMGRSDRRELSREPRCYVTYELNLLNLQVL